MEMYSKKSKSIPQKTLITVLELIIIAISYLILFSNGYNKELGGFDWQSEISIRNLVLFMFNLVVFVRIGFTTFFLVKRRIPWEEAISIPGAFAIYYIGFALLGRLTQIEIDWLDYVAIGVFFLGSYLNTASELKRHFWKMKPENKGKLYTKGLFKFSMHINYFGDVLWVVAYALITRNWWSVSIVFFILAFFIFYNIPKLDEYLASKYKDEFGAYSSKTKKLIPYIY